MSERSLDDLLNEAKRGKAPKEAKASKGSVSLDDLIKQAGGAPAGGGKKKGLLGQVGSIVKAVPSGLVGFGKDLGTELKQAVAPNSLPIVKAFVADPKPRQGETEQQMRERLHPIGMKTKESFKSTLSDIRHPTRFARASDEGTIAAKVLEDIANLSVVLGPVSRGAGAVAERTAASAAAQGATSGAVRRAAVAQPVAKGLHAAAVGTQAVANAPLRPFQLATTGMPAGRVLSHVPGIARGDKVGLLPLAGRGLNRAAESETVVGKVARAAKLDPTSRSLRRDLLNPAAEEHGAVVGRQVALGQEIGKRLQGPLEEQAMFLVGEGQATALAKLRATAPDRFDDFVTETFGDSVDVKAAHLAADVADGVAGPAGDRISEALAVGRMGAGGRIERSEEYLAGGGIPERAAGRQWESGFEPSERAIDKAVEPILQQLPRARDRAADLRGRANSAASQLGQAKADISAQLDDRSQVEGARRLERKRTTLQGAVARQEQRAVTAADRLTSQRDLAEAAKLSPPVEAPPAPRIDVGAKRLTRSLTAAEQRAQAVTAAEDRAVTAAERSVPTVAQQVEQDRRTLKSTYTKAAKERAEQARNDLAPFFADGPLAKVDLKATSADWVRNLPPRVRQALQRGAGFVDDTHGGLGPDEFMHNARRVNASLAGMSDEQIAEYITRLYESYADLRNAPRVRAEEIRPEHLRAAGITDEYLEAIASPSTADDVARFLQEEGIAPSQAEIQGRQIGALTEAGDKLVAAQQIAADVAEQGGTRADVVAAARAELGADAATLAGKHFDKLRAEGKVPAERQKLTSLFDRRGESTGRAAEKANQAHRLSRLESRRLTSLRSQLERLPEDADPAAVKPTYGQGKRLGSLETRARVLENTARSAEARAGRLAESVKVQAATAADSIAAAPARLRPMLEVNRRMTAELKAAGLADAAGRVDVAIAEIPTTLKELEAAGLDVDHFIHVQPGDKPTRPGVTNSDARLPQIRKARSEKFRGENLGFERTVRAQTQAEIDEARAVIARVTADRIAGMGFAAKLGEGPLEGVGTAAEAYALPQKYVPWNPATVFEKGRVGRAEEQAVARGFEGKTVFVPEHIFDGFRSYFNDPTVESILRKTYDPAIHMVKIGQLALSPGWQVGNMVGNVVLATFGAGVDPVTLGTNIVRVLKAYRQSGPKGERSFEKVVPRRLLTAGPTHSEFEWLRGPEDRAFPGARAKVTGKLEESKAGRAALAAGGVPGRVVRASFALNGFIDDVGRSAVFLAKKGKGASDDEAVKLALQAMGDFSRMTPFERRVIRRVIPYYAWSRHITQLAFRLPIEHPYRVAWTLHLADEFADPDTRDMPGSFEGAIRLPGGKLLEPGRLFPFGDAGRILEPQGIGSSLSPIIKIPSQSGLVSPWQGVNLNTGKPFSRPPGTGRFDEFGAALPTAPSLAKQVTDLFPQKRLLEAATGRDQVARYNTGDKVLTKSGPIKTGKTGGLGLLRFLGVPVSDAKQAEEMTKRVADKEKANAQARANYEKKKR